MSVLQCYTQNSMKQIIIIFFFICDDENLIQIERWNFTIHSFIQSHSVNDY